MRDSLTVPRKVFVCAFLLSTLRGIQAQAGDDGGEFDFQTYKIFRVESSVMGDNTECNCTRGEEEAEHSWQPWAACQGHQKSFQCHRGIQYRSRLCSDPSEQKTCKQREWKYCYNEDSCTGQWQSWTYATDAEGACSHSCGGGIRIKVRACEKDNEIGLYCAGKNRSPYDIAREPCNQHRCPSWSDWTLIMSNCTDTKRGNESVTYQRTCSYRGKRSSKCDGGRQQTTTRPCTDTPLSFHVREVAAAEKMTNEAASSPHVATFILVAIACILGVLVAFLSYHYYKSKKIRESEYEMGKRRQSQMLQDTIDGAEKSHSFIASSSVNHPGPPKRGPKSKWTTPENYEQIDPDNEPIHDTVMPFSRQGAAFGPPVVPPPLRRSFTDLDKARIECAPVEYTVMSGSPTTNTPPPCNGHRVLPIPGTPRKGPKLPIPRRKPTEDYLPPPPPRLELSTDFTVSGKIKRRSGSMGAYNYGVDPTVEDFSFDATRPTTLGRKDKKERKNKKRHKSDAGDRVGKRFGKHKEKQPHAVSRGDSVGFSKLHGGVPLQVKKDGSNQSHLYAEIHDNTRF